MLKRTFDLFVSFLLLVVLSPLFAVLALAVALESRGGAWYVQRRVGRHNRDFRLFKFRTMRPGADRAGLLTVGSSDSRTTRLGRFLRKYKLDELPQLVNVLNGTMSLVGPRPEVRKYVDLYTERQRRVLSVRPGITDYASIAYAAENELLAAAADPEKEYVERILPRKLELAERYVDEQGMRTDLRILGATVRRVITGR